jgi:hypothetical protein
MCALRKGVGPDTVVLCRNLEFERPADGECPLIPAFSPGGGEGGRRPDEGEAPRRHWPQPSFLQSKPASGRHRRRREKRWPPLDLISGRCAVESFEPEV